MTECDLAEPNVRLLLISDRHSLPTASMIIALPTAENFSTVKCIRYDDSRVADINNWEKRKDNVREKRNWELERDRRTIGEVDIQTEKEMESTGKWLPFYFRSLAQSSWLLVPMLF